MHRNLIIVCVFVLTSCGSGKDFTENSQSKTKDISENHLVKGKLLVGATLNHNELSSKKGRVVFKGF